jgi:type III secretion system FlhB-like substrate exporter
MAWEAHWHDNNNMRNIAGRKTYFQRLKDMTTHTRPQMNDLSSVYGVSRKSSLSQEGKAVIDLMKEFDLPIHKDPSLRAMLMELDSYKNMPKKYFSALSDVLVYAMNNNESNSQDMGNRAKANS